MTTRPPTEHEPEIDALNADLSRLPVERVMTTPDLHRDPCPDCGEETALVPTVGTDEHRVGDGPPVRLDVEPTSLGRYIIVGAGLTAQPVAVQVGADTARAITAYAPAGGRPTPLYMAHSQSCAFGARRTRAAMWPAGPPPEPAPRLFDVKPLGRPDVEPSRRPDVGTS